MRFQDYLKKLFEIQAWRVELLDNPDSVGIHLIATRESQQYGIRIVEEIQTQTGPEHVREAMSGADSLMLMRAAVISQGEFSEAAKREARQFSPTVVLVDRSMIARVGHFLEFPPDDEPLAVKKPFPIVKALVILSILGLVGGGGFLGYMTYMSQPPPVIVAEATPTPVPTPEPPPATPEPTPEPTPAPDNTLTADEEANGWVLLFDGESVEGWTNTDRKPARALVSDGTINPHKCGEPAIFSYLAFDNFELSFDYKVEGGFDRGVLLRTFPIQAVPGATLLDLGLEVSLADKYDGSTESAGGFYNFVAPAENAAKPAGEWNRVFIRANFYIVTVNLNGKDVASINLEEWTEPHLRPDGSRHRLPFPLQKRSRRGHIGLPDPGKHSWYKNIKIRRLDEWGF